MSSRKIALGFAIVLTCAAVPVHAQEARANRSPTQESSFWSWSAVSALSEISRLWLGNWACSGAYADGPTIDNCGALTSVPNRRKRVVDEREPRLD